MKIILILLSIAVISVSCIMSKKDLHQSNDPIIAYLDSITMHTDFHEKDLFSTSDTSGFDYRLPIYEITDYDKYWEITGNFIDSSKIHALVIDRNDSCLNFYFLKNKNWEKVGSQKIDIENISGVSFVDMNGDNKNEIICYTYPNMNGNIWPTVYISNNDSIKYAGGFETEFRIKKEQQRLETDYGGSWWMPLVRTIYMWRNDKLVPIKKLQISLKEADMEHNDRTIEYFENPTFDQDSLISVFSRDYSEKDQDIFDNFFENN